MIKPHIFAALALMPVLAGCKWDAQEITEIEDISARTSHSADCETTVGEYADETDAADCEAVAKELLERWLGLLAEGDEAAAEELVSYRIGIVEPEFRLFNTEYPRAAEIAYYAPSAVEKDGIGTMVTLKVMVIPEDDAYDRVNADIMVWVSGNGSAYIEYITEMGSNMMTERKLYRRAARAYDEAVKLYGKLDPKPLEGMHHMGEGSELTGGIESKLRPSETESFSIAVRDGEVMYVSWSDGITTQRYPPASQETS